MGLEMTPQVFHRVEFGRIRGQPFHLHPTACTGHVLAHQLAPVDRGPVPENQQFAGHMLLQVLEEFDDVGPFEGSGMNLKVEAQQHQTANEGQALPVEGLLQQRRLPAWGPGPPAGRPSAQPAFVDEDDLAALLGSFFLAWAPPPSSTAESLPRSVQLPAARAADN